jgi:MFS family permease
MSCVRSVFSLLLTTAFLLTGHGLHMTFLPLMASEIGLSQTVIGLSGSAYFVGFISGALVTPHIIAKVGHIRSFTTLMAVFLCCFQVLPMSDAGWVWILARFLLGAVMCGAYTVVESWLSDQADSRSHGRVLGIYTLVVLAAMAAGQGILGLTYGDAAQVFAVISILIGCAIIPVSLTSSLAPAPVPATRIDFMKLYRRSHTAFAGALGSGVVIGTFWTLGAVHVVSVTGDAEFAPMFIAVSILGGALVQYPIGIASDHIDRRHVLTFLCAMSSLSALYLSTATDTTSLLIGAAAFGAASNSLYAVSLAKAADNSERDEFVMIGSSVLLLNAVGAAIGSFIFGWAMRSAEGEILFTLMAIACALFAAFIAIQPKGATAVATEEQSTFVPATSATAPAALQQDPRAGDIAEEDQLAPAESVVSAAEEVSDVEYSPAA